MHKEPDESRSTGFTTSISERKTVILVTNVTLRVLVRTYCASLIVIVSEQPCSQIRNACLIEACLPHLSYRLTVGLDLATVHTIFAETP
jgi:hypothetical protein